MRLIDADKLIEDMRNKWDMQDLYLPIHFKELLIDEQPTAFDVDKVVKQLEEKSEMVSIPHHSIVEKIEVILTKDVIDIVKAGGIDE